MMRTLITGIALLALTGCGSPAPDEAAPAGPSGPQLAGSRPADIPIGDLEPCNLLTEAQRAELVVGRPRLNKPDGRVLQSCGWSRSPEEPIEGYLLGPTRGNPAALLQAGDRSASEISVAGFPAVQAEANYSSDGTTCTVLVDVAPDEILELIYGYNGTELQPTLEQSCAKARRAAEMAMQTLIAQQGS